MKKCVFACLICLSIPLLSIAQNQPGLGKKILFIRGGDGSGGLGSGDDTHLSDITDFSTNGGNRGWGTLASILEAEGYTLEQIKEGSDGDTPVDLSSLNLSQYAVVVFGSNNATYESSTVDVWLDYINQGGAALFISDANFGSNWNDAPSSDNHFLPRIGWEVNQDAGTYDLDTFEDPNHPILSGLNSIGGEGVSPITVKDYNVSGVSSTILIKVPSGRNVRRITNNDSRGSTTSATPDDAVLVIADVGSGRVAGHFDRNTFFNENGAGGRDITKQDHSQYARNLFNWLAGVNADAPNQEPSVQITTLQDGFTFNVGAKIIVAANISDPDGEPVTAGLFIDNMLIREISQPPYEWGMGEDDPELGALEPGNYQIRVTATDSRGGSSSSSASITVIDPSAAQKWGGEDNLDTPTWRSGTVRIGSNSAVTAPGVKLQVEGGNFYMNGNMGIGIRSPERPMHLRAFNAIFRIDRDRPDPGFAVVRYDQGFQNVWKSFYFYTLGQGPNDGKFVIADWGTDVSGPEHVARLVVANNGNVGIGNYQVTNPSEKLTVAGNARANAFLTSSDKRLKENILPIQDAAQKLDRLNGVRYNFKTTQYKKRNLPSGQNLGLLAQDVQKVFPELVAEDEEGMLAVNYGGLIPVLVEALKSQNQRIAQLEEKISHLDQDAMDIPNAPSALYQNHPNPFDQQTEITFFLSQEVESAEIFIYDFQGKQIKKMSILQRGEGKVALQARSLEAGMYFYSLIADGKEVAMKRMIITE